VLAALGSEWPKLVRVSGRGLGMTDDQHTHRAQDMWR
jgi:hypothetical protein